MAWAVAIFGAVLITVYVFQSVRYLHYLWRLMRWRQASDRYSANQCLHCGYDLRATPDRCPERGERGRGASR